MFYQEKFTLLSELQPKGVTVHTFARSIPWLVLEKEPDNEFDKEAIMITMKGIGKAGYTANSPHTVIGESMSAGRLYDKIGNKAKAKVVLVTEHGVICKISKKSLIPMIYVKEEGKIVE